MASMTWGGKASNKTMFNQMSNFTTSNIIYNSGKIGSKT